MASPNTTGIEWSPKWLHLFNDHLLYQEEYMTMIAVGMGNITYFSYANFTPRDSREMVPIFKIFVAIWHTLSSKADCFKQTSNLL